MKLTRNTCRKTFCIYNMGLHFVFILVVRWDYETLPKQHEKCQIHYKFSTQSVDTKKIY